MTINEIAEQEYKHAERNGFYGDNPELAIMEKLEEEATELQEAMANDDYRPFPNIPADDKEFVKVFEKYIKDSVGGEFADNIITLFSSGKKLGLPLELLVKCGLRYNSLRGDHNGKG